MNFLDYIAGGGTGPHLTSGAIGPSFLTWEQKDFRAMRRKYGEGELDAGNYYLSQIHFNKETGTGSLGQLDVGPSSWYGTPSHEHHSCDCARDVNCCA